MGHRGQRIAFILAYLIAASLVYLYIDRLQFQLDLDSVILEGYSRRLPVWMALLSVACSIFLFLAIWLAAIWWRRGHH